MALCAYVSLIYFSSKGVSSLKKVLVGTHISMYDNLQYSTIQYNTIQYNTIQYSLF